MRKGAMRKVLRFEGKSLFFVFAGTCFHQKGLSDWQAYPASWQQQSLSFHPQGRIQCPHRQNRPELELQAAT